MTEILKIDPGAPAPATIDRAVSVLRRGDLVAMPTETVYGLAARALDGDAVAGIFRAKGRPATNPLIVHVAGEADVRAVVAEWPDAAARLAKAFWPGPLTLVLPRRPEVPAEVSAGLDTVAVRAPDHAVAQALIAAAGPLAAPSANRSTQISPTTAAHVMTGLGGRIAMILDAGPCTVGIESTVLSLLDARPTILRPGGVGRTALEAVIGAVEIATDVQADTAPRTSPGTAARHYAPNAAVRFVARGDAGALTTIAGAASGRVGALLHTLPVAATIPGRVLPDDPVAYAAGLYAALHELDAICDLIVIEAVPEGEPWRAVADRLARASHASEDANDGAP